MTTTDTVQMMIYSIVIIAKCPIPGKSKTRLIPYFTSKNDDDEEAAAIAAAILAKNMLVDVLWTIHQLVVSK